MTDKQKAIVNYIYASAIECGGFRAAIDFANAHKAPRKLRRAAKLQKKILRGWLRASEGKPTQPIAAKHLKR